ncbi:MAG: hypothetical protein RJA07_2145 [Bacteroidota bacterium]
MKKIFVILFLFQLSNLAASAQSTILKGNIIDEKKQAIVGATIAAIMPNDKDIIAGTVSDIDGNFTLSISTIKRFSIRITYIGYKPFRKTIFAKDSIINLGTIALEDDGTLLKQVNITELQTRVKQKGDTTEINANAFKTNPDATSEDLVNKMPGITSQNGQIQAHGETVKQVLVDGKPFFGDDPATTLKNLPSDAIDKIQIFDKKSDQSVFTGFDDGNTSKSINVITKQNFRNGTFGKVYGGFGLDLNNAGVYKSGVVINKFKGQRRITLLMQSNNINEQNFAMEDLMGVMGGGGGGMMGMMNRGGRGMGGNGGGGGGNDPSNFMVNGQSGITTTHAAGLNYSDKWGKKTEATASYFFNYSDNKNETDLLRQYLSSKTSNLNYSQNSFTETKNQNHRFNFRLESKIDSMNSIVFAPKISIQKNNTLSTLSGMNKNSEGTLLSNTSTYNNADKTALNLSSNILWRHSFHKKYRTLSVNFTPGYNSQIGTTHYNSYTKDTLQNADSLKQLIDLNKKGYNNNTTIIYTEPIDSAQSILFSYSNTFNVNDSKKYSNNFSSTKNDYNILDTILSNVFNSLYLTHSVGAGYNLKYKKINLTAGSYYQWAELTNKQAFPSNYTLHKQFNSLLPNVMLMYKISNEKMLRVFYRTSNTSPTVDQLQEVYNVTNPLQISTGNTDLKQDYSHNLVMRFANMNAKKNTSFFAMIGGTVTDNYIGNSTSIAHKNTLLDNGVMLAQGGSLVKPINLNGYYNARTFIVYGRPIKKIKSNYNINFSANYTQTPSLVNGLKNNSTTPNASLGLGLSSSTNPKFDYNISSSTSYNISKNSLQTNLNQTYVSQTSRLKLTVMPYKGLVITSDVTHQYYNGLSSNFNQNYVLLNAGIGYKFLKHQSADLRLIAFDLLNQNTAISRNITETYIEDSKTKVLQRYFMLVFTYTFKTFKGKTPGSENNWMMHQPPPGGMPPPGGRF